MMVKKIALIKVPIEVIIRYGIANKNPSKVLDNIPKLSNIELDFFLLFFKIVFTLKL